MNQSAKLKVRPSIRKKSLDQYFAMLLLVLIVFTGAQLTASAESEKSSHQLVVLTAHNKIMMDEFSRAFSEYYQKRFKRQVKMRFVNQGDETLNLRYLKELQAQQRADMPVDILWGGSPVVFDQLSSAGILAKSRSGAALKSSLDNLLIDDKFKYSSDFSWVAASLTGYGILVNWAALKEKTSDLGTGARELKLENLSFPGFKNLILVMDPRKSKSFGAICSAVVQNFGWDRGLQIIESIIVHSRSVTMRDATALDAVSRGEVGVSFAADFAAYQLMLNQNRPELEYSAVTPTHSLHADPLARIQGAANPEVSERFLEFVMSREGQSLLQLAKGIPNGPVSNNIARISIRQDVARARNARLVNPINPFLKTEVVETETPNSMLVPDDLLSELIGVIYIDQHQNWLKLEELNPPRNAGTRREAWLGLAFLPRQEKLEAVLKRWSQSKQRAKMIQEWRQAVGLYLSKRLPESNE
jgi:ABC-type Fe3+ transport system substrate-binding protein